MIVWRSRVKKYAFLFKIFEDLSHYDHWRGVSCPLDYTESSLIPPASSNWAQNSDDFSWLFIVSTTVLILWLRFAKSFNHSITRSYRKTSKCLFICQLMYNAYRELNTWFEQFYLRCFGRVQHIRCSVFRDWIMFWWNPTSFSFIPISMGIDCALFSLFCVTYFWSSVALGYKP